MATAPQLSVFPVLIEITTIEIFLLEKRVVIFFNWLEELKENFEFFFVVTQ
jgi:hypothetical protein